MIKTWIPIFLLLPSFALQSQAPIEPITSQGLASELNEMARLDQEVRDKSQTVGKEYGADSPEYLLVQEEMERLGAEHQQRLEEIIDNTGWPKISEVGFVAARNSWLILQHSDLKFQKRMLPVLKQSVDEQETQADSYALLYDRILMLEQKKQYYGTQLICPLEIEGCYFWPMDSYDDVNERRLSLGMSTLEEMLVTFPMKDQLVEPPEDVIAEVIDL